MFRAQIASLIYNGEKDRVILISKTGYEEQEFSIAFYYYFEIIVNDDLAHAPNVRSRDIHLYI